MNAVNFLPRTITETHRKAIQKREAYELKQKNKIAQIPPENDKRVRDNVTQLAFVIRQANFNVENLRKLKAFSPERLGIDDQLDALVKLEEYFVKSEKAVDENWIEQFNNFENFVWDYTNHTPENKYRIIKFSRSLWNKKY